MYRLPRNCPTGSLLEWCNVLTTWPTWPTWPMWQHMATSNIQQHPATSKLCSPSALPGPYRSALPLRSIHGTHDSWPRTKASAEPMDPAATGSCQGLDGVVMSFVRPWKVPRGHAVFKVAEGNFRKKLCDHYVILFQFYVVLSFSETKYRSVVRLVGSSNQEILGDPRRLEANIRPSTNIKWGGCWNWDQIYSSNRMQIRCWILFAKFPTCKRTNIYWTPTRPPFSCKFSFAVAEVANTSTLSVCKPCGARNIMRFDIFWQSGLILSIDLSS